MYKTVALPLSYGRNITTLQTMTDTSNRKSIVMIIDVDDFYDIRFAKDKDRAILAINPKAEDFELLRLKKLDIETWVKDVLFEKLFLFREFLNELMLL